MNHDLPVVVHLSYSAEGPFGFPDLLPGLGLQIHRASHDL